MALNQSEQLQVIEAYHALERALDALVLGIQSERELPAEVGILPTRQVEESSKRSLIEVEWLKGQQARDVASHAYRQVTYEKNQHARTTLRLPGLIAASPSTLWHALEVNRMKRAVMTLLPKVFGRQGHADVEGRYPQLRQAIPSLKHICVLQVAREILVLDPAPEWVKFSWSSKHATSKRRSREWVFALLARRIQDASNPARRAMLEDYLVRLTQSLPHEQDEIVERWVISPLPMLTTHTLSRRRAYKATLPVLVPEASTFPKVAPLANYNAAFRRRTRSDSCVQTPALIPEFHFYLPADSVRLALVPEAPALEVRKDALHVRLRVPSVASLRNVLVDALALDGAGKTGEFHISPGPERGFLLSIPGGSPLLWSRTAAQAFLKTLPQ